MKHLILGGARSGKSRRAEQMAADSGKSVTYIATATALDDEMQDRIAHHQQQRPAHWMLVEEPLALADALRQSAAPDRCIIVDCLTLWLNNLLCGNNEQRMQSEIALLLEALPQLKGDIILVSNETGMGIVPLGELSRQFVDTAGRLHQSLATLCDHVTLVVAGLPLNLK